MLELYQEMWDGHSGYIKVPKQRSCSTFVPSRRALVTTVLNRPYKKLSVKSTEPTRHGCLRTCWYYRMGSADRLCPKKNGTLRFCVNYQKLNDVSVRKLYLHLRINECIDSLGEARLLPTQEANSTCWKIEIEKSDRQKCGGFIEPIWSKYDVFWLFEHVPELRFV